jgi:FSR family fosmidomycin resistance protein-like MFS transporter
MPVLAALSVAHLLNDLIQSLIPAIYPVIKDASHLDFAQIGLITLAFQSPSGRKLSRTSRL